MYGYFNSRQCKLRVSKSAGSSLCFAVSIAGVNSCLMTHLGRLVERNLMFSFQKEQLLPGLPFALKVLLTLQRTTARIIMASAFTVTLDPRFVALDHAIDISINTHGWRPPESNNLALSINPRTSRQLPHHTAPIRGAETSTTGPIGSHTSATLCTRSLPRYKTTLCTESESNKILKLHPASVSGPVLVCRACLHSLKPPSLIVL